MSRRWQTGLIVLGFALELLLLVLVVVASWRVGRFAARLDPAARHDAPLVWRADSVFRAERGRGGEVNPGPALAGADWRQVRLAGLPASVLFGPAVIASGVAAGWAALDGRTADEARHEEKLLGLRLESGKVPGAARAALRAGYCRLELGEHDEARRLLELAYGLHRLCGETGDAAWSLEHLATLAMNSGEHDEAEARLLDALAIHRQLADDEGVGRVLTNLGVNRHHQRAYRRAIRWYLAAREHGRSAGTDDWLLRDNLVMLLEALGPDRFARLCEPTLGAEAVQELVAELQKSGPPVSGG